MFARQVPGAGIRAVPPFWFGAFLIAACCLPAYAADPSTEAQPRVAITPRQPTGGIQIARSAANLRLDVKLILIPVSVTDAVDHPITDLPRDSFRLLEDGVEQQVAAFSQEEGPVSLVILFDSSGSMRDRIETSVASLKEFFQTAIPGDEYSIVQFSDTARLLTGFTPAPDEIFHKLGQVQAKGWTALLDAIALGSHQMRLAKNVRKVLLILSDGGDNNSRFTESEVRRMVLEADLRIYGIGIMHRPRLLQQLAEETGGRVLIAQNLSQLPEVVQKLSAEIRSQYMLGYSSMNAINDGKYHRVKIELQRQSGAPQLRVAWRHGYYAPGE